MGGFPSVTGSQTNEYFNLASSVAANVPQLVFNGPCILQGWSMVEFYGRSDCELDFYDDNQTPLSGAALYLGSANLAAADEDNVWNLNLAMVRGIVINLQVGRCVGTVRWSV